MHQPDPVKTVRTLMAERFPDALQAWLGGSAHTGRLTTTSDLDVTVLTAKTEVRRESVTCLGWPVELFVHTEASIRAFVRKDTAARRPTMARLVASSRPVLPGTGGAQLRAYCLGVLEAGPPPLSESELQLARYFLTDLLDDLDGGGPRSQRDAVVVETWRHAAELLLASKRRWTGSGKWLIREIEALDRDYGTDFATRFHEALADAVAGGTAVLGRLVDEVLAPVGGRLRDGFRLAASLPPDAENPENGR